MIELRGTEKGVHAQTNGTKNNSVIDKSDFRGIVASNAYRYPREIQFSVERR